MCLCVGVCLLQVNEVWKFCGFALLKLCCDCGRVKLFVAMPLMNSSHGKINGMLFWQILRRGHEMEWINGGLQKTKYQVLGWRVVMLEYK